MKNRNQGQSNEQSVLHFFGLTAVPGSGCGMFNKCDGKSPSWIVEIKSTRNATIKIPIKWWSKVLDAIKNDVRDGALSIRFVVRHGDGDGELGCVLVDEKRFYDFWERVGVFKGVIFLDDTDTVPPGVKGRVLKESTLRDIRGATVMPYILGQYRLMMVSESLFKTMLDNSK